MNYNQLIRKLLAGDELNALERAELESFDADLAVQERESAILERDKLKNEHDFLKRAKNLQEISTRYNCSEPDFLDYLAAREHVDLEDKKAVEKFVSSLQQSHPHCFFSRVRSSGEMSGAEKKSAPAEPVNCDRIGRIAASIACAPETRV